MATLIAKIDKLIKKERTTPERKHQDVTKSSNEILSELFSVFNADPPKIEDISVRKSKKSKKKHKKEKKKRSRSTSSSDSDESEYYHKRKKRKKSKSKRKERSSRRTPSSDGSRTPVLIKDEVDFSKGKYDTKVETPTVKTEINVKSELPDTNISIKKEEEKPGASFDASLIPMPESPKDIEKSDKKSENSDCDKSRGKIQIKNLKFSAVFEETVKKAEEEARKKAEQVEDGECTDSSSSSVKELDINSQFPKSSDPGGILKKQAAEEIKLIEEEKNALKKSKVETSIKSSKKERERSRSRKRSESKSRGRSHSSKRRRHRSRSRSRRRSRSRHRSRSRRSSKSRSQHHSRHSPRHRGRRSRSPSGVKLADSEKKRLLEVARRNAINMLKNGAVPAGAAALPPHTRNQVMAAIQSGGKSVDELTDFCKHLSKKEALGELSSVSSNDDDMSENEDTLAFHHPFLVKEKAPIVMNIRGGAPLPVKTSLLPVVNKEELRLQFPVSSGSQHREKASEWVPVSPKRDMQVAKLNSKPAAPKSILPAIEPSKNDVLALPAPPPSTTYTKSFTTSSQLPPIPALPAPGPQVYPPGVEPPKLDMAAIVCQKLLMIRKEQEENELNTTTGFGWSKEALGQFTGSTGAQILTPRELASGTQAWAKKLLSDKEPRAVRCGTVRR
ncbi:protein Son isoform X2 [Papilio machaon]|uniref:protein Son isoform X2 n=1 Tax=Papilio machaon TaxID=76193 RepID=UPI001E662CBC|nr:protein Son isoform X2 [Papilio machaon]